MEIDHLTVTPISLTFRTNQRIRWFRALRHTHDSFPRQRYRDGEPLSRTISQTIQVTLRYVAIAPCINIEYNLDAEEK